LQISFGKGGGERQFCFPTVVIDRPRAKDVVVLQRVTGRRLGIVNGVCL
jgi:hypothetical protein